MLKPFSILDVVDATPAGEHRHPSQRRRTRSRGDSRINICEERQSSLRYPSLPALLSPATTRCRRRRRAGCWGWCSPPTWCAGRPSSYSTLLLGCVAACVPPQLQCLRWLSGLDTPPPPSTLLSTLSSTLSLEDLSRDCSVVKGPIQLQTTTARLSKC